MKKVHGGHFAGYFSWDHLYIDEILVLAIAGIQDRCEKYRIRAALNVVLWLVVWNSPLQPIPLPNFECGFVRATSMTWWYKTFWLKACLKVEALVVSTLFLWLHVWCAWLVTTFHRFWWGMFVTMSWDSKLNTTTYNVTIMWLTKRFNRTLLR